MLTKYETYILSECTSSHSSK